LFDVYVSALDHALREEGVGDVSVGKKMRKLGEALYGRMNAYETPLRDADTAALTQALARNVYAEPEAEQAEALARYAIAVRAGLAAQKFNEVLARPAWTEI
ncbi:MAG: ubiquinol-cytochrome C chaperone family protein, partial [Phenylobacterium sp.]|nr:ubiquinol-cytochrome C chaperone family protein [Phenylobacterium sp.]